MELTPTLTGPTQFLSANVWGLVSFAVSEKFINASHLILFGSQIGWMRKAWVDHGMPDHVPLWVNRWDPGPWFNIKMSSYQYRKSHCGDKTILRPSYLHNGISYTDKTASLYWIGAQAIVVWHAHCPALVSLQMEVKKIRSCQISTTLFSVKMRIINFYLRRARTLRVIAVFCCSPSSVTSFA